MVEIHFGCGGEDSKLFVEDLATLYQKYAESQRLKVETLSTSEGHVLLQISGSKAGECFQWETGKHVVQRIPPSENKGRKQTSVISVNVLPLPPAYQLTPLPEAEVEITTQCGHGPGGQNINRVHSAVRIVHLPTGLKVFINGRDQGRNKKKALEILTARVNELKNSQVQQEYSALRNVDTGRGDKVRTYNFLKNFVTDHRLNKKTKNVKAVMKGDLSFLTEADD